MKKCLFIIILITSLLAACNQEPVTLRLMTHDSFEISEDILTQFETETGIQVEIFKSGDAGLMVN
jgi:thiamine transport system substrate-binding protein